MARPLTIYRRYFYQSDCYNAGTKITPAGVQVHSTGANNPYLRRYVQPDDGRIGRNPNGNDHNHPGGNVCASAYIGKQADGTPAVYQALPWNMRCWLSGSGPNGNANRLGYIGFEVCEDDLRDRSYFETAVMGLGVLLTAYLCQEYGIPPGNVLDHHELHSMGLASNHADITHWLDHYGLDMNNFRDQVAYALEDGVEVTYVDCDEIQGLYDAKAVNPGTYLNLRSGPGTGYASIGRIPRGAIVLVMDDADPEWWRVYYQGQYGYAMSMYLERLDDPAPPAPDPPEDPPAPEDPKPEAPPGEPDRPVEIPRDLAADLYRILGEQLTVDARSGNISDIDYQ